MKMINNEDDLLLQFYPIGQYNDMDELYHNSSKIILKNKERQGWLIHRNEWSIDSHITITKTRLVCNSYVNTWR